MADQRLTDATGETTGFLCDSAGRKTITDACGSLKAYYDSVNDKTFTATGTLVGNGDLRLKTPSDSMLGVATPALEKRLLTLAQWMFFSF